MFQASINDAVIAEANTRTELAAQVAHMGHSIDDCGVDAVACFGHQTVKARAHLGLGTAHEMLYRCGSNGLPLATLEHFCQDGHTEDDELEDLADAFEQAGATKAAAICRQHIGL